MRTVAVMGLVLAVGAIAAQAGSLRIAAPAVSSALTSTPTATDSAPIAGQAAVSPPAPLWSRLHVGGRKWVAPQLQRSEAGLSVTLSPKVTLELNYERTAQAPTMPHDHDDGFLTRLKLGF